MLDEWNNVIASLNFKVTASSSELNYQIIKHLPPIFIDFFIYFFNIMLDFRCIPALWKTSNIFIIPKPDKYYYNIVNTRSIALLDVFRKLATKILDSHLSLLISKYQIL